MKLVHPEASLPLSRQTSRPQILPCHLGCIPLVLIWSKQGLITPFMYSPSNLSKTQSIPSGPSFLFRLDWHLPSDTNSAFRVHVPQMKTHAYIAIYFPTTSANSAILNFVRGFRGLLDHFNSDNDMEGRGIHQRSAGGQECSSKLCAGLPRWTGRESWYLPVPGVVVFCTPTSLESSLKFEQGTTLVWKVQHIRFPEVTEDKTNSLREATREPG